MLYLSEDFTKVYLIIYNLGQFIGFIYVFAVMAIRYSRDGPGIFLYTHYLNFFLLYKEYALKIVLMLLWNLYTVNNLVLQKRFINIFL